MRGTSTTLCLWVQELRCGIRRFLGLGVSSIRLPGYQVSQRVGGDGDMDVDDTPSSGFDTRSKHASNAINNAVDFELPDYWDEGEPLERRDMWPICVTLNVVRYVLLLLLRRRHLYLTTWLMAY